MLKTIEQFITAQSWFYPSLAIGFVLIKCMIFDWKKLIQFYIFVLNIVNKTCCVIGWEKRWDYI